MKLIRVFLAISKDFFGLPMNKALIKYGRKKKYKVSCKYVKKIKQTITSVNFPETALDELLKQFEIEGCLIHRMNDYVRVQVKEQISFRDFKDWKVRVVNTLDIKEQIMSFSLSTKTPIDAFEFIQNLQTDLQANLIIPNY